MKCCVRESLTKKKREKLMEGIYAFADQIKVYKAILDATQEIQNYLRYHSGKSHFT